VPSQNHLFKIVGRRKLGDSEEERVFLFREFSAKIFMRKIRTRFPDWEFEGEPELAQPTPPDNAPARIDTLSRGAKTGD